MRKFIYILGSYVLTSFAFIGGAYIVKNVFYKDKDTILFRERD